MNPNDRNKLAEEGFEDLLGGLERLAQNLDAQTYAGQAWPVARRRPARRRTWSVAASLAAAAAMVAMIVYFQARPRTATAPAGGNVVARASMPSEDQSPEDPAIPEILIVEDADSYSIIDMTSGAPLVSFATRDSYCPVCVVPLLPEQTTQPTTTVKKI